MRRGTVITLSISRVLKSTHPLRDATAKYSARLCKKTTFRVSIFYFLIQTYEMNKKRAIFHLFWCESFREILSTWDSHDSLVINFPVRCIYCTGQRLWCQMDLSRFILSWKTLAGSNPICLKAGVGSLITTVIICLPRTEAWTVNLSSCRENCLYGFSNGIWDDCLIASGLRFLILLRLVRRWLSRLVLFRSCCPRLYQFQCWSSAALFTYLAIPSCDHSRFVLLPMQPGIWTFRYDMQELPGEPKKAPWEFLLCWDPFVS